MQAIIVLGQMMVLLVMMSIGYFSYKKEVVDQNTAGQLSSLVVNVFNPILVVNGVLGSQQKGGLDSILLNLAMVLLYFTVLILASFPLSKILRVEKKVFTTNRLMLIFGNLGFMGIPVLRSIYGDDAMIYVAFYILVYNILLYTYGMRLAEKAGEEFHQKTEPKRNRAANLKRICNPGVFASLAAVLIFLFPPALPQPVYTFCDYMGNTTVPLSMILIGISVARENLGEVFRERRIYGFILLRMVALPVALTLLLKSFVPDSMILGVFAILMGMPVGSIVSMMIKEKGGADQYCIKGVVLSTLFSIVTIPFICIFL